MERTGVQLGGSSSDFGSTYFEVREQWRGQAWDGYLVLLTPSLQPSSTWTEGTEIRYNTSRVRKLVGTCDDLKSLRDVQNILQPVLPVFRRDRRH